MFKIGYFARISGVAIDTLRYYDRVGLLKPDQIDHFTGYRYYSLRQLRQLNRILALKDLGLSLDQIHQVMKSHLSAEELRGMLRLAQVELAATIQAMQARLIRVQQRLSQLESEGKMKEQDIVLKASQPLRVIAAHHTSGEFWYTIFQRLYQTVRHYADTHQARITGPLMAVYHEDPIASNGECDFEVVLPTDSHLPDNDLSLTGNVQIHTLPAIELMATTLHYGPMEEIYLVYDLILEWIFENGYAIAGPYRAIHHHWEPNGNPATFVTEIQFPITRSPASAQQ